MEWTPVVFVTFKALVLGIGMFFAIKWHYDQGKKGHVMDKRAFLRAAGKVAAVFVLAALGLTLLTLFLMKVVGLNLTYP